VEFAFKLYVLYVLRQQQQEGSQVGSNKTTKARLLQFFRLELLWFGFLLSTLDHLFVIYFVRALHRIS